MLHLKYPQITQVSIKPLESWFQISIMLVVNCYSKLSNQSMAGWRRVALAFLATAELLRGGWRGALWATGR